MLTEKAAGLLAFAVTCALVFAACQARTPEFVPKNTDLQVVDKEEFYSIEAIYHDWSLEKMMEKAEELGLQTLQEDESGIVFYDDTVKYSYFSWSGMWDERDQIIPDYVMVTAPLEGGLRNIQTGETFDQVMDRFPQWKDWRTDEWGAFYGEGYEWPGEGVEHVPRGQVREYEAEKSIVIAGDWAGMIVFFFDEKDILTSYIYYNEFGC